MPKGYARVFTGSPRKPLTAAAKASIEAQCAGVIEILRNRCIQPSNPDFGYTVDIYGAWYRNYYYFIQKMRYDGPGSGRGADFKFTRLECFENGTCNLSYMRHTSQWFEVFNGLSLRDALDEIQNNPVFYPG